MVGIAVGGHDIHCLESRWQELTGVHISGGQKATVNPHQQWEITIHWSHYKTAVQQH